MGRLILALTLTYIVATGLGMARAHGADGPQMTVTRQCAPPDKVHKRLITKYEESVFGAGVASNGKLVSVYVNDETGTFTIVVTNPGGLACMVIGGDGWRAAPEESVLDPKV